MEGTDYDILFQMLSNERRRNVIRHLYTEQSTVALGCIAEQLAAAENDCAVTGLNSQQRKRTYVSLYQSHLPKMADAGLIVYNRDRGTLGPGPHLEIAHEYLTDQSTGSETLLFAYTAPPVAVGITAFFLFSSPLIGLTVSGITICLLFLGLLTITRLDD